MDWVRPLLMYALLPVWMLAGLADWACHRRTAIERTGGVRESAFHWAMFLQMALGTLAVLLLEVNAALLLLGGLLFLAHEVTVWLELRFVVGRREVSPIEQMVHSFMEILPLAALFLLALLVFDRGPMEGAAAWTPRLKDDPLPASYVGAAIAGAALLNVLPLAEESWRCWRGRGAARTPQPGPPR